MTQCGSCCDPLPIQWTCSDLIASNPSCKQIQSDMRLDMVLSNIVYVGPPLLVLFMRRGVFKEQVVIEDVILMTSFVVLCVVSCMYHACDRSHSDGLVCNWDEVKCGFDDVQMRTIDCLTAATVSHFTLLLTGLHHPDSDPDDIHDEHRKSLIFPTKTTLCIMLTAILPYFAILMSEDSAMYYGSVAAVLVCDVALRMWHHFQTSAVPKSVIYQRLNGKRRWIDAVPIWSNLQAGFLVAGLICFTFAISIDWAGPDKLYHARHAGWHLFTGLGAAFAVVGLMRPYDLSAQKKQLNSWH